MAAVTAFAAVLAAAVAPIDDFTQHRHTDDPLSSAPHKKMRGGVAGSLRADAMVGAAGSRIPNVVGSSATDDSDVPSGSDLVPRLGVYIAAPPAAEAPASQLLDLDAAQVSAVAAYLLRAAGQRGHDPPTLALGPSDPRMVALPAPPPQGTVRVLLQSSDGRIVPGRVVWEAPAAAVATTHLSS
jgi:hypothetical protein